MFWWIVGIVAVWILVGGFAAFWIGRSISHTKLEESAAELRRDEMYGTQTGGRPPIEQAPTPQPPAPSRRSWLSRSRRG